MGKYGPKDSGRQSPSNDGVETRNYYAPLANLQNGNSSQRITDNGNNSHHTQADSNKPPPIILPMNQNQIKMIQVINAKIKSTVHGKITNNNNELKLQCKNETDYKGVIEYLTQKNIPYYTFTPHSTKPIKMVLKGLPADIKDEIFNELQSRQMKPKSVVEMKPREEKLRDPNFIYHPIYKVDFEPSIRISDVFNMNYLLHCRVYWEKFKKKNPTQCFNCQSFGHAASNCNLTPKCVKCGRDHDSRKCQKPLEVDPKCANCGGKHTASYRKCKAYEEYTEKHMTKQSYIKKDNNEPKATPPRKTYAAAVSNKEQIEETQESLQLLTDFRNLIDELKTLNQLLNFKKTAEALSEINKKIKTNQLDKFNALIAINNINTNENNDG